MDTIYLHVLTVDAVIGTIWEDGPLDVLLNNAAGNFIAQTHRLSHRALDSVLNIVLHGTAYCTIACGRIARVDKEHYTVVNRPEYWGASGGLEYEAAWALGPDTGVDDLDALTYVNFLCNEDGFDPISFGSTLAAAMELYQMGVITAEETGGVALNFGSAEALTRMAELVGKGEGFGQVLGLGSKRLCEKYGMPDLRPFFDCDIRWLKHYGFVPLDVPNVAAGLVR